MTNSRGEGTSVSIVIPCFNRAALVGEALASALAYGAGAEIIVVDDGSTDESWNAITAFNGRVRCFRIANGGVSAARNFGVAQASGAFIRFLDSDDRLAPQGVSALVAAQRTAPPNAIVFGDASAIDLDGAALATCGYGYAAVASPGPITRAVLLSQIMSPWLPLYPKAALQRLGGFDTSFMLGEDQELAVRLAAAGHTFHRVPVVVAEVREHPGNRLSRSGGAALHERHILLFARLVQLLRDSPRPISADEASALAAMIWSTARDAARARHRDQATRLFSLAQSLVGRTGAAPARLRAIYRLLDPYTAEQAIERVKSLRGYLMTRAGRDTVREA